MGSISKGFSLLLVVILAVSSLIMVESANAQTSKIQPLSNPVILAPSTPPPTPTPMPTPVVTPTRSIAIDYDEVSRTTEGANTILTLNVNARYNFGDTAIFNFQDFILNIFTDVTHGLPPTVFHEHSIDVSPIETGSITVGDTNKEANFQLTFNFPTMQTTFYGDEQDFTSYELAYTGSTAISSLPPQTPITTSPTPANPNLSLNLSSLTAIGIVAVIVALVAISLIYLRRHRKTILQNKPNV
jgi:hypothetical protein